MRGRQVSLVTLGICVGVTVVATLILRSQVDVTQENVPAHDVAVVSSHAPVSPPTPASVPNVSQAGKQDSDASTIAPYRTAVSNALGLTAKVIFRNVVVANAQQHIVCGAVSTNAGVDYQPFVYVGNAAVAALDDGSPDFKELQIGACGASLSR